jgi:hypothetical protein
MWTHAARAPHLELHRPLGRFAPVAGYSGLRPETRKLNLQNAQ